MLEIESTLKSLEFATACVGLATACVGLYKTSRPDADPSVAKRARILRGLIVLASFVVILGITAFTAFSRYFLSTSLEIHDPEVFSLNTKDIRVARVFPDRSILKQEGNFATILKGAKNFEIDTTSAHELLSNDTRAFTEALGDGVAMRFLLFDATDGNKENCDCYAATTKRTCDELKGYLDIAMRKLRGIKVAAPKGSLEVKLYRDPPLKSFWITDPGTDRSVVQVEFHENEDHLEQRASFRVGRLESTGLLEKNLHDRFNEQWDKESRSVPLTPDTNGLAHQ